MKAKLRLGGEGRISRRTRTAAAGILAVAIVVAGAAANARSARSTTTDQVKLTMMSVAQSAGVEAAWRDLIAAYEKQNPTVTIVRTPVPFANYRTQVKLRASSPNAPDLIEGDLGPGGVMASLVVPGLLLPIDKYAAKYRWQKKFGKLYRQLRISADGKIVGTGPIYGVPGFAELLGFFYNKALLAQLHLNLPKTYAQFEASLRTAKSGGVTPILIGGLDKWPWMHFWEVLADHFGNPTQMIQWFNGNPHATVDTPGMRKSVTVLRQWVVNGYFGDNVNGITDSDSVAQFGQGKSLYMVNGPWDNQVLREALGSKVGFFLLPAAKAGAFPASTGWMGWDVGIAAKSKNPDVAATFLNFLTSATARVIFLKHENPAGTPGPATGVAPNSLVGTVARLYSREVAAGTLVPYIDVAYPSAPPYDFVGDMQATVAGKMTPAAFLKKLQAGWAAFHGYK